MSIETSSTRILLFVGIVALFVASGVPGEPPPKECTDPVLGIIEGPDPVTGRCRNENHSELRLDSPGRSARNPHSGQQVDVWAAQIAVDHDIALVEWGPDGPGRTIYLTSALTDDLDPQVAFDADGGLHVVWWSRGERDEIVYARRDARGDRWYPDRIVATGGRSPALVVDGRAAWFAFVRAVPGGSEIVLVEPGESGAGVSSVAARTTDGNVAKLRLELSDGAPVIHWTASDGRVLRAERWGTVWVRYDAEAPAR